MISHENRMSMLRSRLEQSMDVAVNNIAAFGDTDIFPPPDEVIGMFRDRQNVVRRVMALHDDFVSTGAMSPPDLIRCLVPAGYLGQRLATQIPPLWNAYYLGIVIACAPRIEHLRVSSSKVFSYRFVSSNDQSQIFDAEIGWSGFMDATVQLSAQDAYVAITDIAHFYHRIRINTVAQALERAGIENSLRELLIKVLEIFEVDRYGLPVGGPASRLLAELVLARVDALLEQKSIPFVRFVDDIRLFAKSEDGAQRSLLVLANILGEDGFFLQKQKTQVIRSVDLIQEINLSRKTALSPMEGAENNAPGVALLPHDPYSELRAQMNQQLSRFASHPDSVARIMREFSKSRLNVSMARNLLASVSYLPTEQAGDVLVALMEISHGSVMIPVFSRLMEALESNLSRLPASAIDTIQERLRALAFGDEAVVMFDFHRALCIRLLGRLPIGDVDSFVLDLDQLEINTASGLVRREIVAVRGQCGMIRTSARQSSLANKVCFDD